MKIITIVTEKASDRELAAVLPPKGVASVAITRISGPRPPSAPVGSFRTFSNPNRFRAAYRVDVTVDEAAVETVFDAVSFAYGAGFLSDTEMWVNDSPLALSA